ncbi:MAG: hypothetical protein ABI639_12525, partial [Thermoanaerobaculia bacterium]
MTAARVHQSARVVLPSTGISTDSSTDITFASREFATTSQRPVLESWTHWLEASRPASLRRRIRAMSTKPVFRYEIPPGLSDVPSYMRTFDFDGEFINGAHAFFATCPTRDHLIDLGIDGWLRREDALKLYELAYFASGPILEIGSYQGLSTSILVRATRDSGRRNRIVSVELDAAA